MLNVPLPTEPTENQRLELIVPPAWVSVALPPVELPLSPAMMTRSALTVPPLTVMLAESVFAGAIWMLTSGSPAGVETPVVPPPTTSVPPRTVVPPVYVLVAVRVSVPVLILVRPPSGVAPRDESCNSGVAMVMLKPLVSTVPPPPLIVVGIVLGRKDVLLVEALTVPPSK